MNIALLSDIHGNNEALAAVLEEVARAGIHELFITGDFLGYYYGHKQVFELLRGFEWIGIGGNHDAQLKEFLAGNKEAIAKYRSSFGSSIDVAIKTLSKKEIQTLISLPPAREIRREGKRILLCHGTPWDQNERIYPDAPSEIFKRLAALGYDFVIMGHTHYPVVRREAGVTIINPGSVGQPRDEGSSASWSIADFATGEVELRRTRFSSEKTVQDIERYNPQYPYLKEVLLRKRKL